MLPYYLPWSAKSTLNSLSASQKEDDNPYRPGSFPLEQPDPSGVDPPQERSHLRRPRPNENEDDGNPASPNDPKPKRAKLPDHIPIEEFDNLFDQSLTCQGPKRNTSVCFTKQKQPDWLSALGQAHMNEEGVWNLHIPDYLLAHIAGFKGNFEREFNLYNNTNLLPEIFSLVNSKFCRPPPIPYFKQVPNSAYTTVKACIKALSLSLVQANLTYSTHWRNLHILDHLILPSVWANIEALRNAVRTMRASVLPINTPPNLKYRFINASLASWWPEDDSLIMECRKFFRAKKIKSLSQNRGRGTSRGHFRGRGYRSFSRGRRNRGRGRRGGFQADSSRANPSQANNPSN